MGQSHLSGSYSHHLRLCSALWLRTSLTERAYRFACTRATPPERSSDFSRSSSTTFYHCRCCCSATLALFTYFEPRLFSVVVTCIIIFFSQPAVMVYLKVPGNVVHCVRTIMHPLADQGDNPAMSPSRFRPPWGGTESVKIWWWVTW